MACTPTIQKQFPSPFPITTYLSAASVVQLLGSSRYTRLPETHKKTMALIVVKYYSYAGTQNNKM